jgi:hypothetical protein
MCGIVRANPKFTPDAKSIMLFGPGVIEVVKANRTRARKVSSGIRTPERQSDPVICVASSEEGLMPVIGSFRSIRKRNLEAWVKAISE